MQLVSCHNGVLRTLSVRSLQVARASGPCFLSEEEIRAGSSCHARAFHTGLPVLDGLCPGGAFALGAMHEVLSEPGRGRPSYFALLLAKSAAEASPGGAVVWSDPKGELYPPALAAAGLPLERLFLLRPKTADDEVWAVTECLRSKGVAATVAALERLSDIQARRLQLAAERGGGVGLLLRSSGRRSAAHYAAATRWLVNPHPLPPPREGERSDMRVQRWMVQLVHGHGGQVEKPVVLEVSRGTANALDHVCAFEAVADRRDTPEVVARVPA